VTITNSGVEAPKLAMTYFLLEAVMFDKERGVPAMRIIGKAPQTIAVLAGFTMPDEITLLMREGVEVWSSRVGQNGAICEPGN
jgi:hypothetical protein